MSIKSIRHLSLALVYLPGYLFRQVATLFIMYLLTSALSPGFALGLPPSQRMSPLASLLNSYLRFYKSKGPRWSFGSQSSPQPQALRTGAIAAWPHLSAQLPSDPRAAWTHLFPSSRSNQAEKGAGFIWPEMAVASGCSSIPPPPRLGQRSWNPPPPMVGFRGRHLSWMVISELLGSATPIEATKTDTSGLNPSSAI